MRADRLKFTSPFTVFFALATTFFAAKMAGAGTGEADLAAAAAALLIFSAKRTDLRAVFSTAATAACKFFLDGGIVVSFIFV
jgi:hypothetical protein